MWYNYCIKINVKRHFFIDSLQPPLFWACSKGKIDLIELLLSNPKVDPETVFLSISDSTPFPSIKPDIWTYSPLVEVCGS